VSGSQGNNSEPLIPYEIYAPSNRMVSQLQPMSCGLACVRQMLKDSGVKVTESEIIKMLSKAPFGIDHFKPQEGTVVEQLQFVINQLHPDHKFISGSVEPGAFNALNKRGSWIAMLGSNSKNIPNHYVIVDGMKGDNVLIRDPWGLVAPGKGRGLEAEWSISKFMDAWNWTRCNAIFPDKK
jgi:predicted double-glycine peptidase